EPTRIAGPMAPGLRPPRSAKAPVPVDVVPPNTRESLSAGSESADRRVWIAVVVAAEEDKGTDVEQGVPGIVRDGHGGVVQQLLPGQLEALQGRVVGISQRLQDRVCQDTLWDAAGVEAVRRVKVADLHAGEAERLSRQGAQAEQVDHRNPPG